MTFVKCFETVNQSTEADMQQTSQAMEVSRGIAIRASGWKRVQCRVVLELLTWAGVSFSHVFVRLGV